MHPLREIGDGLQTGQIERFVDHLGAERFDFWQQSNRLNHFTLTEIWKDQAALDAHNAAPGTRAFRDQIGRMLGALYDDRRYRNLE